MNFLKLNAICAQPLAIRMLVSQFILYLAIIIYFSFLSIDEQNFTWLQASLLGNLRWVEIHHSNLACNNHHIVLGNSVTGRTQTVSIQQSASISTITEKQCCRTVPRLHQNRIIFIESFQILRNRILVVEAFWHHHSHCMR